MPYILGHCVMRVFTVKIDTFTTHTSQVPIIDIQRKRGIEEKGQQAQQRQISLFMQIFMTLLCALHSCSHSI